MLNSFIKNFFKRTIYLTILIKNIAYEMFFWNKHYFIQFYIAVLDIIIIIIIIIIIYLFYNKL